MMNTMRFVGLLLFLAGAAGTGYAIRGSFGDRQPRAALHGLGSAVTILLALLGLLLVFVPEFFR
jgi:hypothetical protein